MIFTRNTILEFHHFNTHVIYNCIDGGICYGVIHIKVSSILLLKKTKCYELVLDLPPENKKISIEGLIYKAVRSHPTFSRLELIEAVDIKDTLRIKHHEQMGCARTSLRSKDKIYFQLT